MPTTTTPDPGSLGSLGSSVSRRDRQRAATEAEIRGVARRLLAAGGLEALTLRGIAREMGMTAPAIYRYFASLEDLVGALCEELFGESAAAIGAAIEDSGATDLNARMHVAIRAFRSWALSRPAEFLLMFRRPVTPLEEVWASAKHDSFAGLFLEMFVRLVDQGGVRLPPAEAVPASACASLHAFARAHHLELADPALWAFSRSWVRLYSVICLEILGQLEFMFEDVTPYFEAELAAVAESLGMTYVPPDGGGRAAS